MGFHLANFGLFRFFLRSRVRSRHARDGQTDTGHGHHFIMPLPTEVGGIIIPAACPVQTWTDTEARFPLPELTARVNGPSTRVVGTGLDSTPVSATQESAHYEFDPGIAVFDLV